MVTPGLLPEADPPKPFPPALRWILALLVLLLVASTATAVLLVLRLKEERDKAYVKIEELGALLTRRAAPRPASLPPPPPDPVPAPVPIPPPPPPVADRPPVPEDRAERLRLGAQEFRAGRYERAELHFIRADAPVHGVLTCLARGDWREAFASVTRAAAADPLWFRRVAPRDLFGSPDEVARLMAALETRVRENPLDAQARILLAYLYYHEKGAPYSKGLLVEVPATAPEAGEAAKFLENLEK